MKAKLFFVGALASLLFAGCVVQSIQPLFTEKEYISHPALSGTWIQKDEEKEQGSWTFESQESRYRLTHRDEKGRVATFDVVAGKIGTNVFVDFSPSDPSPDHGLNDLMAVSLIPAHVFAKLVKTNEALLLVAMDYEWLEKQLKENPKLVPHIVQDKRPILTASTAELQKFIGKYADDEKIFKNVITLTRKKP